MATSALEHVLGLEHLERRERGRARERVARVRVAVEERLELRELAEERLVDALGRQRRRERQVAAGQALGHAHEVGATPSCWQANIVPVRPKPVATSSQISSTPWRSHSSRTARR